MTKIKTIDFSELHWEGDADSLPKMRDSLYDFPHPHENDIAWYLEHAPAYAGVGRVVGDVLDPAVKVILFPGSRTDGVYLWPSELPYYVRTYHLRLPTEFVERMAALNWQPPAKSSINWENLGEGLAT
jgi:hypothetical protein